MNDKPQSHFSMHFQRIAYEKDENVFMGCYNTGKNSECVILQCFTTHYSNVPVEEAEGPHIFPRLVPDIYVLTRTISNCWWLVGQLVRTNYYLSYIVRSGVDHGLTDRQVRLRQTPILILSDGRNDHVLWNKIQGK